MKGAFLVGGSMVDPKTSYHLELICHHYHLSKELLEYFNQSGFPFKSVVRKTNYVLYLKDSLILERFLYVLGAKKAAFSLVDAKIYKQVQNDNNRINNCAGYNHDKTLDKAIEQLLSIEKIQKYNKFDLLSDDLKEVADLRLQHRMASLSELSSLSDEKYSKASLSRKLAKIVEISNKLDGK